MAASTFKPLTITLTDDGQLCDVDGATTTTIRKLRPNNKAYEWLKFYINHPYQTITKQDLIDNFAGTRYQFLGSDRMCQCIYNAFKEHPSLRTACFPIATTKGVYFRPTFTEADMYEP